MSFWIMVFTWQFLYLYPKDSNSSQAEENEVRLYEALSWDVCKLASQNSLPKITAFIMPQPFVWNWS